MSSMRGLIDKQPAYFEWKYTFVRPEDQLRYWKKQGNKWSETYPNGDVGYFQVTKENQEINAQDMNGIKGTIVARLPELKNLCFIPNIYSRNMWLWYKDEEKGAWRFLGGMSNVAPDILFRKEDKPTDELKKNIDLAAQGNGQALAWVGYQYENGLNVAKDVPMAHWLYEQAATKKDAWAEKRLAELKQDEITKKLVNATKTTSSNSNSTNHITGQLNQLAIKTSESKSFEDNIVVSYQINYDDLTIQEILGQGGFGTVYKGIWRFNTVAIKKLTNQDPSEDTLSEFKAESQVMARLRSPNIVQFYGCTLKPQYSIVMEYMPKGSLYKVLHSKDTLNWDVRYKIIRDIACGLVFLHAENILHRDLKSLNILLNQQNEAKLTDFGLAKLKTESQSTNTKSSAGTIAWMAPEVLDGDGCSQKSDIYSLGMTFWEVASRKTPFENAGGNQTLIMNWVSRGKRDEIPNDCPSKIAKLVKWCWEQKPSERPTAAQVIDYLTKESFEVTSSSTDNTKSGPQYRSS